MPYPAIRFLLGRGGENEDPQISKAVEEEIEKFGDIIVGSFKDTYDNLPLKVKTWARLRVISKIVAIYWGQKYGHYMECHYCKDLQFFKNQNLKHTALQT